MAKAFIYWNLHKRCFSVKYQGRVIAHANRIVVLRAKFRVQEAGRQKVLATGRKNVHAGIVANLEDVFCDSDGCERKDVRTGWPNGIAARGSNVRNFGQMIRYNPYDMDHFQIAANGQRVDSAWAVYGSRNLLDNRPALWAERFA